MTAAGSPAIRLIYLGVFLTTLATLVFEISLTRVFSVTMWYHFAYLVVSLGLFGIGAGGIGTFVVQERLSEDVPRWLSRSATALAVSMVGCLLVILNFNLRPSIDARGLGVLTVTYLVCAVPFFFMGATVSLAMRRYAGQVSKVYFADLLGSAAGCLLFLLLISLVSGPSVALLAALLAAGASACFAWSGPRRPPWRGLAALALGVVLVGVGAAATDLFTVKYTKRYKPLHEKLYEKWSPLAQITVFPGVYWRKSDQMLGWGMSPRFSGRKKVEQLWVAQDASAGTPIARFDGDLSQHEYLKHDITALPHYLKAPGKVFILGVGGGRDVLTALAFGNREIHGCDIHPVIIDLIRERFREFAGDLYRRPEVKVEVADGRTALRSTEERYDLLQIPLIDSWAATAAGAFSLAENGLYTVEAFTEYLSRLTDDGVLSVTRYLFKPRNQSLRVVTTARAALARLGVEDPGEHIVVVGVGRRVQLATVMVKRTPFSSDERDRIMRHARRLAFRPLYVPGHNNDRVFEEAIRTPDPEAFFAGHPYDVRPTPDDRPFFFQMVRFADALDLLRGERRAGQRQNYYAVLVLLALLAIAAVLSALFYVLPLARSKKVKGLPRAWGLYFLLLGLGFMFVEIPLLQKGTLYLGHPTWSLSIVLFSMLVSAGLGSFASGRVGDERRARFLARCLLVVAGLVALVTLLLELVVPATLGWSWALRVAITIAATAVVAFPMGFAFPLGVAAVGRTHDAAIPWTWALNGAGSVLGSIAAMSVAMGLGYRVTLAAGVVAYAAAAGLVVLAARRAGPRPRAALGRAPAAPPE